jgi:hypothetical protein
VTKFRNQSIEIIFSAADLAATSADVKTRVANAIAKLKSAGRWLPIFDKLGVPALFAELATSTDAVEFGEGAYKKRQTPLDIFLNFMEQQPPKNVNGRLGVDSASVQFDDAVKTKLRASPEMSYFEAGLQVEREDPRRPHGVNGGRLVVDRTSVQFDDAVKTKLRSCPKMTYFEAAMQVERENFTAR